MIHAGWFDSPFGKTLAMGTDRGLCGLRFVGDMDEDESWQDLASRWPNATIR